ncbi:MAG: hypothetical protein WCG14_01860 [Chlamydiia bacterium]
MHKIWLIFFCFVPLSLCEVSSLFAIEAQEEEPTLTEEKESLWKVKFRARALIKLDKMLDWAFPSNERVYHLDQNQVGAHYVNHADKMVEFSKTFSYFSKKHPIIGTVTSAKEDVVLTIQLLQHAFEGCKNEDFLEVATAEILSKVLAYRMLEEGMVIPIPVVYRYKAPEMVEYKVDKVFNLWSLMPAFGLVPLVKEASAILLYRGTDLSLESKQGWASVLSDLDIQGPGLNAFLNARSDIHAWLKKQADRGCKSRVMGFSLGGVLSTYTIVHEHAYLMDSGSMAFNPPGVSASMYKQWQQVEPKIQKALRVFITHGDLIPKIGKLVGDAHELSLDFSLKPLDAHVRLICCQPNVYQFVIDQDLENKKRR